MTAASPTPQRPEIHASAQCACGAVSVAARGTVRSMFLCACEDCQRATGTGHAAVLMLRADDVTVSGPTRAYATQAQSGATMTRWTCARCGTPVAAQSSRATTLINLPVGLFGAAGAGWFRPSQLLFARSLRAWDQVDPDLPRHATYRESP
jgi:hypothetical protein